MAKCPNCGTEISKVKKEWNYSVFHVRMYLCGKCGKTVKIYYRENKLSHTIPKVK